MVSLIAMNGKCCPNKGTAFQQELSVYDMLIKENWLKELVERIRKGDDEAKKKLPFRCPHYTEFKDNKRQQKCIIPQAFTFQTCIDIDDASQVEGAIKAAQELNKQDGIWKGMLLHMDYSARKKLHIDVRMPVGMTIEETQKAYCKAIGVPFDESCITPERFIYITDLSSEIYRSEKWYQVLSEEELKIRHEAFAKRGLSIDGRGKPKDGYQCNNVKMIQCNNGGNLQASPANDRTRYIFNACMKECELEPKAFIEEGARHESVKSVLSVGATQLLSKEEFLGVLSEMMPDNWQDKNIQDLVNDFYAKYHDPSQKMTQFQRKVFAQSRKKADNVEEAEVEEIQPELPPEMPKKLPKLIALLVSKTPDVYKPAVAHAVFPALASHLYKVKFRYIDNVMHEATLMNVLMAGTGAGKDCISQPINYIMADIRRRDEENLERERQWKQEVTSKGANKDKRQRPEGLVIQEIDADMTNPAFVLRMAEADGHFLYTKMNEIDQFDALKGSGKGGQQFQIMCLAFDPGNRYGQTRVGTQSVTEKVCIRFNWNAATTILKGQRYFRNVLTDGPISRINFCTIPEREIGAEMPVYGTYDAAFEEELRPYIERLVKATGEIECPQAFALARKTMEENAEFSRLSQSRVYENLSFRANVIAWLKGCLLYVANDYKWERSIEEFVRWSLKYDLWCKMQFFAEAIEKADFVDVKSKRGPRNLLELLPDEFTIQDAINVRRQQGLTSKGAYMMVRQWLHRGYIDSLTVDSFQKVKKQ